jgi:hypothetical protein
VLKNERKLTYAHLYFQNFFRGLYPRTPVNKGNGREGRGGERKGEEEKGGVGQEWEGRGWDNRGGREGMVEYGRGGRDRREGGTEGGREGNLDPHNVRDGLTPLIIINNKMKLN